MYTLLGIDAVLRITAALVLLFVAVPRLARRRPAELDRMEWFWWCLAAGVTALTLLGQLLTFFNIYSTLTLLLAIAALILAVRARTTGRNPAAQLHDLYRNVILFSLNVLEGRVNVRRRTPFSGSRSSSSPPPSASTAPSPPPTSASPTPTSTSTSCACSNRASRSIRRGVRIRAGCTSCCTRSAS